MYDSRPMRLKPWQYDRYSNYSLKNSCPMTSWNLHTSRCVRRLRMNRSDDILETSLSAFFACLGYVQGLISLLYWHFEGVSQVGINKTNFWDDFRLTVSQFFASFGVSVLFVDISTSAVQKNVSDLADFFLLCVLWLHSLIFFAWTHRLLLDLC